MRSLLPCVLLPIACYGTAPQTPTPIPAATSTLSAAKTDALDAENQMLKAKAEAGDADAQYEMAARYLVGGDECITWLKKAAAQGHVRAQAVLGLEYRYSDPAESAKWYKLAAEAGDPEGMLGYSGALEYGSGLPKDEALALEWMRKAAEAGYAQAQLCLGFSLLHGLRAPHCPEEGVKWLTKAAEQGHLDAILDLGKAYEEGRDVPRDYAEAIRWYREGAANGGRESKFLLGRRYYLDSLNGGTPMYELAFKCFKDCAFREHQIAQYYLACCYAYGRGIAKDEIEALAWLNLVAASGDEDAARLQQQLETKIGAQATLASQKRSKEIRAEIDSVFLGGGRQQ